MGSDAKKAPGVAAEQVNDTDNADTSSKLNRSISVESIAPKLTFLFSRKKRAHESSDDEDESLGDEQGHAKKRKLAEAEELQKLRKREEALDAALPEHLRKFRPYGYKFNIPPSDRPIRIYADGVFDLFHLGHMKQLEQAKKAFENVELVCGVPSDVETHKRKGLTVLTDQQRIDTLKHCRWVDEVIPNAPWCVTTDFLLEHRIDYVAHDDLPYALSDSDDIYKPIKEMGMFLTTQRTEGISTSDIITKIIRDYDKYLMRNFARGATRKELNVSWLKKNELEFKKHINDFRSYWKKNQANLESVSKDLYFEVREYMRGKRFDVASFLEGKLNPSSDTEDNHLVATSTSPMSDFASKYIGNANKELNGPPKLLLANVKEWMNKRESLPSLPHEDGSSLEDDKKVRKIAIPRTKKRA